MVCISRIGFFVDRDHEGQGYVTEAARAAMGSIFEYLGAHRVRMECDDTNERSWRVAERCGMVREGHIRENKVNADGTLSGTVHFGLLKREFETLVKESYYTSIHYIVKPNERLDVSCEIQVRTLFEEIWGEIDHILNYPEPTASVACDEQLRVLSRLIGAGSRLGDAIFRSHREYLESAVHARGS